MSSSLEHYRDDPESQRKYSERIADAFKSNKTAVTKSCSGKSGRLYLRWLAKICGARDDPFTVGDPHATAYKLGRLSVWTEHTNLLHMTSAEIERHIKGPPGSEDE